MSFHYYNNLLSLNEFHFHTQPSYLHTNHLDVFLEYILRLTYTKGFCNIYYLQQSEQGTPANKKPNNSKSKRSHRGTSTNQNPKNSKSKGGHRGTPTNHNSKTAKAKVVIEVDLRIKMLKQQIKA